MISPAPVRIIKPDSTINGNRDGMIISEQYFSPVAVPLDEYSGNRIISINIIIETPAANSFFDLTEKII